MDTEADMGERIQRKIGERVNSGGYRGRYGREKCTKQKESSGRNGRKRHGDEKERSWEE